MTAAPALGPVLGGIVVDVSAWPWLFLLNVPIGVVGLALGWRYVPRGVREDVGLLDRRGLAMLTVGLPLAVYGVTAAGERQTLADARVLVPLLVS